MKKLIYLALLIPFLTLAQRNYLEEGNALLSQNKNKEAEELFKEAIKSEKDNLVYQTQLGLALINQGKYKEAEKQLNKVLSKEPNHTGALWYSGINNFQNANDFRKAILYFEKAYPLIADTSPQFFAVNFFIAKSYRNLLYTEGLTYDETSRMLETSKEYVKLQPDASDAPQFTAFIKYVEENRFPPNVKIWRVMNENSSNALTK
jgi:tetratricopeptide (TPR) repeat protein